jgi:hypothetical protein
MPNYKNNSEIESNNRETEAKTAHLTHIYMCMTDQNGTPYTHIHVHDRSKRHTLHTYTCA